MKILFFIIFAFLGIIGIAHIVFDLSYRLWNLKNDNSYIIIKPDKSDVYDIELSVRSAVYKMKKYFKNGICDIIILSDNLDHNSIRKLNLLQKEYEYLQILSKKDFIEKAGL